MLYLLALLTLLMQPVEDKETIFLNIEISSGEDVKHHFFDPVFVRTSIRNESDQTLEFPHEIFFRNHYTLTRGNYSYRYQNPHLGGVDLRDKEVQSISPGETLIVDYSILEVPLLSEYQNTFWRGNPYERLNSLQAYNTAIPRKYASLIMQGNQSAVTYTAPLMSPRKEMEFLSELFTEGEKLH